MYIVVGLGYAFRGRKDHEVLKANEIRHAVDEHDSKSFDLSPHFFKNLSDDVSLNMRSERLAVRQIHQLDASDPRDPYYIISLYMSHLPLNHEGRFYLRPFTKAQRTTAATLGNDGAAAWYNPKLPIGKNELGSILQ